MRRSFVPNVSMPRRPDHVDPPDPPLSDGTVTLRPMRESDLPGLMEEGRDETTRRWVNVPIPYTETHAREELAQLMGSWDDPASPLAFTITECGSDDYRGVILLSTERPPGIVELAYGVHPAARRRRLVTRAIRLVSPWAFQALGAERLEGRTDPENIASQRALERAGFTREGLERGSRAVQGVRKDMICWSLLPSDLD
jgi:RimJ/RimL family protein N-acetyltransferase